jgi:hypothetical protein
MSKFAQKVVPLQETQSSHRIKVSKLMSLLDKHPYKEQVKSAFKTDDISNEYITLEYVDAVYNRIEYVLKSFNRFNVKAHIKDISLVENLYEVDGISGTPIKFVFDDYVDDQGYELNDLEAFAIHDAISAFLSQYDMAKYANRLYKDKQYALVRHNIEHFRQLASQSNNGNKLRSYRLLEHKGELFVRGITSVNQYNEYGVDFAFVSAVLLFHSIMKENPGDSYRISSAAISASKLELIIRDNNMKEAKGFGKISSSTIISTNDLGKASFKFKNIVKVGIEDSRGVYIFPDSKQDYKNEITITHNTKANNALLSVMEAKTILRSSDEFIEELESVKGISKPDELRARILFKLENRNSPFSQVKTVKDLFRPTITNSLDNFAKLLEMCRKAEELDIDYDLKDKLRYIISAIILNKK